MSAQGKSKNSEKKSSVEAGSIAVFASALFLVISLFTYNPNDPSLFTTSSQAVKNACGHVGAYFASVFFEIFGIAAFLIPAALFFISAAIFKREGRARVLGTLSGMIVAVLAMTVFLALQWNYVSYQGTTLLTGGAFGVWFSQILAHHLNSTGASLVSLMVFSLAIALSTPISVAAAGGRVLGWARILITKVLWRATRIIATYFAFLMGLIAMKGAQASARGMEALIAALVKRAKAVKEANEAKRALAAENAKAARSVKNIKPLIGLGDGAIDDDSEELEAAGVAGIPAAEVAPVELGRAGIVEAENVLPELEKKSVMDVLEDGALDAVAGTPISVAEIRRAQAVGAGAVSDGKLGSIPAILPHELHRQSDLGLAAPDEAKKPTKKRSVLKRGGWKLPPTDYLVRPPKIETQVDKDRLYQNAEILTKKFLDFEIEGEVTAVRPGPVITLYEFKPAAGVKVSRIASLADDISMALSAQSVRIIAPLPGKNVVGIEIPSDVRENVFMREFISHSDFTSSKYQIPVAMGKDIAGNVVLSDLARMPHLLCAGQTGSGKSVFMNGLITSLLYRFTPEEMRMILVDPKMIEFSSYHDIPHLLLPVVDDSSQAASALKWAVREMDRRYRILSMLGVKNLASFNEHVDQIGLDVLEETLTGTENQEEGSEKTSGGDWSEAFEKDEDGNPRYGKLPYIVIVIDELADLMMTAKKEVELSIARIAQKARAAGIHLVIATQRPSTDVVTGIIKANLPSRVSCQLASGIDSKTILDRFGAEKLLGRGDMFFIPPGTSNLLRLHGAYLSDDEINQITSFLREQGKPVYRNEILVDEDEENENAEDGDLSDPIFDQAVELAKKNGQVSASFLQRHLRVGYNRAARLIETMEMRGIVSAADGARPRDVLIR